MTILCLTGPVPEQLDVLSAILYRAGLNPAKPPAAAQAETGMADFATWHQQVLKGLGDPMAVTDTATPPLPGKLWEQLAGELFRANLTTDLWGWSDPNSLWLLDFWLAFEPSLRFILAASPPQTLFAAALRDAHLPSDPEQLLTQWQTAHQRLLRFALRHPERTLLIDADSAVRNPQAFIEQCAAHWTVPLTWPAADQTPDSSPQESPAKALQRLLAHQLLRTTAESDSLSQELASAWVTWESASSLEGSEPAAGIGALIADYRERDQERRQQQASLAALQVELAKVKVDHAQVTERHRQEIESLSSEKTNLAQAHQADQAASAKACEQLDAQVREATEENELLLQQLHQVQEELEAY